MVNKETSGHTEDYKSLDLLHMRLLCASSFHSSLSPPSCRTLPLLFSNLIYFCLFCRFSVKIQQLMTGAYPMPLCLALILSHTPLFSLPHPLSDYSSAFIKLWVSVLSFIYFGSFSFFVTITQSIFFVYTQLSPVCFVCEREFTCFQAHRCALCLSSHLFSPVIPGLTGLYKPSTPNPP